MKPRILLIEDDDATRFGFVRYYEQQGYVVTEAATLRQADELLSAEYFDAIVLDIGMPDGNGVDFIQTIRQHDPVVPVIVMTGAGDIAIAVDAMQRGADNFITKPIDEISLTVFLKKNLELGELKRRQFMRKQKESREDSVFGEAQTMIKLLEHARIAAASDGPVLITGETGTGKGMLATWIHRNSKRSSYECIELNCSALQGNLLARELFGHVRGAFTSADRDSKGLLDSADRGTLFLDEIADMPLELQPTFLKVLEDKTYRRLGDVKLHKSNFRLICATNHTIADAADKGLFRQDLLYRINLITLHLPPLRERLDDLPRLTANILKTVGSAATTLNRSVMSRLETYHWPGNIRELKNVLERAVLLAQGEQIQPQHLLGLDRTPPPTAQASTTQSIRDAEQAHVRAVLAQADGNVNKAAQLLGISRATLYRKLKSSPGS